MIALISESNVFHDLGAATWNDLSPRMSLILFLHGLGQLMKLCKAVFEEKGALYSLSLCNPEFSSIGFL